jgi:hypothetical protein
MSLDQATYLASLTDQYRQSGQSQDVFLTQLSQNDQTKQRADYLRNLSPQIQQTLFDSTPKSPQEILSLLDPMPNDASKQAETQ